MQETSGQLRNNTNIVLSPYTVWMAMSIVNEGARGNTAAELSRALFIPTNESDRKPFRELQQRLTEAIKVSFLVSGLRVDSVHDRRVRI